MKRILSLITRRAFAHLLVLAGAAVTAVGAALIYMPVGVMLGGVALGAWALLIFDVDGRR